MNKYKSKARWGALLAIAMALGACTADFENINTNPNSPVDVPAANILANATIEAGKDLSGWLNHTYTALWCQMFAKVQYIDEDRYEYRPTNMNGFWSGSYLVMKDLQIVIDKTQEDGFTNIEGAARVMLAHTFLTVTDLWGDIPYSEALTGDKEGGTTTPVYDAQEDIYAGLLDDLTTAAGLFDADGLDLEALASADVLYDGDITLWEKFANSLKLRIYMRMSGKDEATAKAGIQGLASGKIFTSNDDDAQLVYLTAQSHWNPLYDANYTRTDFSTSKTLIDILQDPGRNDPRLPFYAQKRALVDTVIDGTDTTYVNKYVGQPNGALLDPVITHVSLIGIPFGYTSTAPQVFMSYAEVEFILAEAALNGWSVGTTAEAAYEAGITASMEKVGVDAADITTYLTETLVAHGGSVTAEQIGTQKWLALYPQGTEGFAEVRRTGFPKLTEPEASGYPGQGLPLRFAYPDEEYAYNEAHVSTAATGITDNMYGKKLWWDVRVRGADNM